MPFSGPSDSKLPERILDLPESDRKVWVKVWNDSYDSCIADGGSASSCEESAFRSANGVLKDIKSNMQLYTNQIDTTLTKRITFEGREYLVAPTVAIKSGVLNNILVPESELNKFIQAWNGRPIPINHPIKDNEPISANSPDIYKSQVIGTFWNAHFEDDSLKGEIWIDINKAERFGDDGNLILQKLESGDLIDVSTAYFADTESHQGTLNGKQYHAVARNLRPDHIAILPNEPGACSVADGCGVPRTNNSDNGEGDPESENDNVNNDPSTRQVADQSFISNLVTNVINSVSQKEWSPKMDRKKTIETLVANTRCKCTKDQLEAMEDDTLKAFAESLSDGETEEGTGNNQGNNQPATNNADTNTDEDPKPDTPTTPTTPETPEEIATLNANINWLKESMPTINSLVTELKTHVDKERKHLIDQLVANIRCDFSKEELEEFNQPTLQKLYRSLAPADYSPMGMAHNRATGDDEEWEEMAMPHGESDK